MSIFMVLALPLTGKILLPFFVAAAVAGVYFAVRFVSTSAVKK